MSMPKSSFHQAAVRAIVTAVPQTERSIDDEIDLFGGNEKQIARLKKTIGLNKRRVVDAQTTAADLCESAARHLMAQSGLAAEEVDALVCVTQTPDHSQPCNAAVLHGRLGLPKACAALDVNLGCSGYVYGLWLAHMMIGSGGCEKVLLLAGDTISRIVHPRDRAVAPLFGDGGSATLVERDPDGSAAWFSLETDGTGCGALIVPAGGFRRPSSAQTQTETEDEAGNIRTPEHLFMDGAEVFNFSIQVEPAAVQDIADYAGVELDAIDFFVFHQANRYILTNIAKRLKLDLTKVPMETVERYGNQSSASIPSAICGELAAELTTASPRRLLLSGFGVGLSWGSAILDCRKLSVCEIIEHEG